MELSNNNNIICSCLLGPNLLVLHLALGVGKKYGLKKSFLLQEGVPEPKV